MKLQILLAQGIKLTLESKSVMSAITYFSRV